MRIGGPYWIHLIEEATCCRPQNHPNSYEECYDEDAGLKWSECKQGGYYIAGIYRGTCDKFDCLDKIRCCKMKTGNLLSSVYLEKKIAWSWKLKENITHCNNAANTRKQSSKTTPK